MASIATDFQSESKTPRQKIGKENLRNIPEKVNVGNDDAKKFLKSPNPPSKNSKATVDFQSQEHSTTVQGYARKQRKRFGIDPNSSPFQNDALKPAKAQTSRSAKSSVVVSTSWNNTYDVPPTNASSKFSICYLSPDEDCNDVPDSHSSVQYNKFKPLSREALKLKLAGGEKTKTGINSMKDTGDVNALKDEKDKVEEFFPEWTQHTGGALKSIAVGKKKYTRRTKKQLQEIRKAKSKARLEKMKQEEMKRRAARHLQCIQKLRLRRLSIMPITLPYSNRNKGTDSIERFRQSLAPATDAQASVDLPKPVTKTSQDSGLVDLSNQLSGLKVSLPQTMTSRDSSRGQGQAISASALRLALEFLSAKDLLSITWSVSHLWMQTSNVVASWVVASEHLSLEQLNNPKALSPNLLSNWRGMQRTFPWGVFLADGAYKSVYKVWNNVKHRMEAISVMDCKSIVEMGNEEVIKQEVQISALLSELVTEKKCPNFIETFQVFQYAYAPPEKLWAARKSDAICPHEQQYLHEARAEQGTKKRGVRSKRSKTYKPKGSKSCHTYIRMELCDGGDLETYLRNPEMNTNGALAAEEISSMLFQMIASLAVGQSEMNLRHYDVKLLNFFLKSICASGADADSQKADCVHIASYNFGGKIYNITAPNERPYLVKLADYGTADISPETLGSEITMAQFTTFENVAPDFYILGSAARQNFKADSFSLGLAFLHLLTGSMPYEEILEDVTCPVELVGCWRDAWASGSSENGKYSSLRRILRCEENVITITNTLYRFLVMIGLPNSEKVEKFDSVYNYEKNPILNALQKLFKLRYKHGGSKKAKILRGSGKLWNNYTRQCKEYHIYNGSNEYMRRAQTHMQSITGAKDLLQQLLQFHPDRRISMPDAVAHEMFYAFKGEDVNASTPKVE